MNAPDENRKFMTRKRVVPIGLFTAALGITVAVWVSNGSDWGGLNGATTCAANSVAQSELRAVAVGELAALQSSNSGRNYADLSFIDGEGAQLTLADFSGKALLVNFWATWCGPCREEMPALDFLSATYGGDDFAVITINLDIGSNGPVLAAAYLAENNLANLPLLADPSFDAFNRLKNQGVSLGLPTTLLLDAEGCELAVLQGPAPWEGAQGRVVVETLIDLVNA